jgi:single-stranded-DNA-specific exonuclease
MKVILKSNTMEKNPNESWRDYVLRLEGLFPQWVEAGWDEMWSFNFNNIEKATEMIDRHLHDDRKTIGILVDSDTDGYCSAAQMYLWLKGKNPNKRIEFHMYEGKVHGILDNDANSFQYFDLLIVPDAGSGQKKEMEVLVARGIEVLILDHHDMDEDLTNERLVLINPKSKNCPYPNKNLSGAGVTWKFMGYYDTQNNCEDYKKYIDLAAVATVADVMSIKELENKAIVNIGLKNIINPFIKAAANNLYALAGKDVTAIGVAFYIAPLINAVIRIGTLEEKKQLFRAFIGECSSEALIADFKKIKTQQDSKKEKTMMSIGLSLQRNGRDKGAIIFGEAPEGLHKSMTGLVAGNLAGSYLRPAMLARDKGENWEGSLRSLQNSNIENFKDFCEETGLFNWLAG